MTLPIRHLPVLQNWDCHVCGNCCKEYPVTITDEEKKRIENQLWEKDAALAGMPLFKALGPFWNRRYQLNRRPDGSCVFLSEEGRCRIHERFGADAKPLPCRLYPFVLIPAGDHWRVGMRFACPSAAANMGQRLTGHDAALKEFAGQLESRERIADRIRLKNLPPPSLQPGQFIEWSDLFRFVEAIANLLRDAQDRLERRLRKCLNLAKLCRQAKFDTVKGKRLEEFLSVISSNLDAEVPVKPPSQPPSWMGGILFRQALALFARKDSGPNRGLAAKGRLALFAAACRFARGRGRVPRLHDHLGHTTFAEIETRHEPPTPEIEALLERYYLTKVGSLQFFGPGYFDVSLWEGLEALIVTFPAVRWLARAMPDVDRLEATARAVSMVDDHFGFNLVLGTARQRLSFRILARSGELEKLVAWYAR
ncbi:MAG: YkgJ family cysteine cluster protein [Gemmataceae bacterium]